MLKDTPIILGISAASGVVYSIRLLKFLLENDYKVVVIVSESSYDIFKYELGITLSTDPDLQKKELLSFMNLDTNQNLILYSNHNLSASVSSGSFVTQGMIILPCSMNTLASIYSGIADRLITRAADVCIKQGRRLLLAPREMPFSTIHLRNMHSLSEMGVKIVVPSPPFYNNPETIDDMINIVAGKILDVFEVPNDLYRRWK